MKKGMVGVTAAISGAVVGAAITDRLVKTQVAEKQKMSDKHFNLFMMMNKWVRAKQDGRSMVSFFQKEGYKEIAIYGMSYIGETLVEELRNSDIKIKYGIDKNADKIYCDFDVVVPNDHLDKVDVIVVTAITFFEEIECFLREKVDCPIISLDDIMFEM